MRMACGVQNRPQPIDCDVEIADATVTVARAADDCGVSDGSGSGRGVLRQVRLHQGLQVGNVRLGLMKRQEPATERSWTMFEAHD